MTRRIRQLLSLLLAVTTLLTHGSVAYASNSSIGSIDELHGSSGSDGNGMDGGARFMSDKYRDNYYLDIEELGIMDVMPAAGSALANTIFYLDRMLVDLTTTIFYLCSTIKIVDIMANVWDEMQTAIKTNIFDAMLPFAVIATLAYIAVLVLKQNGQAIVGQLTQFFVIMLAVTLLTTNTASVVGFVDDLTMGVSNELVAAIYGVEGNTDTNPNSYAATVAGGMWETMIHTPWVALNLEGSGEDAEPLLSLSPSSIERKNLIKVQTDKSSNTLFLKSKAWGQFGILILYTVPLLARCAIYLCLGGMMLAFRLFTVILALFGIIILFLALFPQLGGIAIVYRWLQKMLNIQINILTLSLMLAFIMRIDKTLYSYFDKDGFGWLLIVFMQTLMCALIFLMRKQLLGISKTIGQAVNGTQMTQRMLTRSDDAIYNAPRNIATAARATKAFVGNQLGAATHGVANVQAVVERRSREINAHRQERQTQRPVYAAGESVYVYDTPVQHSASGGTVGISPTYQPAAALARPRLSLDSTVSVAATTPATLPARPKLQGSVAQKTVPGQPTHTGATATRAETAQTMPTPTRATPVMQVDSVVDTARRPSLQTVQNSPVVDIFPVASVLTAPKAQRTTAPPRAPQGDVAQPHRSYQRPTTIREQVTLAELRSKKA